MARVTKQILRLFNKLKRRNKVSSLDEAKKKKKKKKKLHLVLDLDHTLLHTVIVSQLSQKEKYLIEEVDSREDLWSFDDNELLIKLRPFVREFLQEANKLFYLYVYTMGNRDYAKTVLSLIDPENIYFGDRVITRDESPYKKTLNLLVADKRRVVIVDDTRDVWPHHKRNLVEIKKYFYFREEKESISYAEKKRDESRSKGALANVLRLLKRAHRRFGDEFDSKDMRLLIRDPCRQSCF